MKSVKYLDDVAQRLNLATDAAIAAELGWTAGAVSHYRKGLRVMSNEACLAVALKLGIDPLPVIMAADIDRAEKAGQTSLWSVFSQRRTTAASTLLFVLVNLFLTPQNAEAAARLTLDGYSPASSLYYVKFYSKITEPIAAI
jgi:hypothetical protein